MMRKPFVLLWTFAVLSLLFIYAGLQRQDVEFHFAAVIAPMMPETIVHMLVNTPVCVIPNMDPMDSSIAEFVQPEPELDCGKGSKPVIHSNNTHLWISDSNLTCYYQKLEFAENDDYRYFGDWQEIPPGGVSTGQDTEFVQVRCNSSDEVVERDSPLRDFQAFVPRKDKVEKRSNTTSAAQEVSVLMLGLDSVSRLNFHRQMPHTLQLLRRLGAVEMMGYNKVADNTFPNMVPVLAGLSEKELQKNCWPNKRSHFDKCPFIWKDIIKSGYRTLFLEDIPYLGMFNFEKKGFRRPPTDYYLRPFMKALDEELGHTGLETSNRCAGTRLQIEVILDYVEKFTSTFANDLYWGLVWSTSMSHDDLNGPQLIDALMHDKLEKLFRYNLLNNTVVVLLSDHGSRIGKIRATHQGRLEERLPFLSFVFPEWFKRRYSSAVEVLQTNARRLTSPYDLHETLMDVLYLSTLGSRPPTARGMSLLGPEPVPLNRTCEQAGISDHWCTCHKSTVIDITSSEAEKAAETLVDYINEMLKPHHPMCAKLYLARVVDVRAWQHPQQSKSGTDYLVTVETSPSGALFEATVVKHGKNLEAQRGDISRINRYGNQSACIDDFHMKLFCYCV